ncbi:MAG TPA: M4 family metallopeptidase, partial [Bryobacteraceae bacterium]|nr:M4 family metallopeptidase [Bryobacteraceae bacterium]
MTKRTMSLLCLTALLAWGQRRPLSQAQLDSLEAQTPARLELSQTTANSLRTRYGLDLQHTFKRVIHSQDKFGTLHVKHQQFFNGIPVRNTQIITHLEAQGTFLAPTANVYSNIVVPAKPALSGAEIKQSLWLELGKRRELMNIPADAIDAQLEVQIHPELERVRVAGPNPATGDGNADDFVQQLRGFRLVYFGIVKPSAGGAFFFLPEYVLVDGMTGRVIHTWPATQSVDVKTPATGSGTGMYTGLVSLNTTKNSTSGLFEMADRTRGSGEGNTTRSLKNLESMAAADAVLITDADNTWGTGKQFNDQSGQSTIQGDGQTTAVDVFWGVARTWDTLKNVFNQKGIDGSGTAIETRVHWKKGYTDARWSGAEKAAFFGDGVVSEDEEVQRNPNAALSTVGHELGHGLWGNYVGIYAGEARGLNEGHGDIMGAIVEFYTYASKGQGNLLKYDEASWNFNGRMVNPTSYSAGGQIGLRYYATDSATREEHTVGCTYGHMFVMLVQGASHQASSPTYSKYFPNGMAGIGIQDAADIWYLATTAFQPTEEATFSTMRDSWLKAAEYLFGAGHVRYKAVVNAWAAIGVGVAEKDMQKPQILNVNHEIDNLEGILNVHVSADDDTGITRVEYGVNEGIWETDTVWPFSKRLDISRLAAGPNYTGVVKVFDALGNVAVKTFPFVVDPKPNLIQNGSLENGLQAWVATSSEVRNVAESVAYIGSAYLRFRDNGHRAVQRLTIPATATSATLSFRVRVENPGQNAADILSVQVLDGKTDSTLALISLITAGTDTTNDFYNNYAKRTVNMLAYRGKDIKIAFIANLGQDDLTRFVVDAVTLTYQAPQSVTAALDLDEGADIIRVKVGSTTGITNNMIHHVDFRVNGSKIGAASQAPWHEAFSIAGAQKGDYTLTAHVIGHDNNEIEKSSPVPFTIYGRTNLLVNSGFESGVTGWTMTGNQSGVGQNSGEAQLYHAHVGTRYARFIGTGALNTSAIR